MDINFDRILTRTGTASVKHDGRASYFGSDELIPLWLADMDFAAPHAITQALAERAAHPVYGYTFYPDSLFDALIDWFRRRHHWQIERDWILMAPGVVPSLHAAVLAFTRPGDPVIVQPPVYFPFFSSVTATGRQLVLNPMRVENGRYRFDFAHLEECAQAGARLLLLCSPQNPVGRVWQRDELTELLRLARRYRLTILADEIHADLVYPGIHHVPLATLAEPGDDIITAIAPSKTFNIPGLGLSCLIAPDPEQRAKIKPVFDSVHLNNSNPFSIAGFEAAYRSGEDWLEQLLPYLRDNRDCVDTFLRERLPEIRLTAAEGTCLLWLDCRALGLNDNALREFFIREARVGLVAGTVFGQGGNGFMRINIGSPRSIIVAALERIERAVRARK